MKKERKTQQEAPGKTGGRSGRPRNAQQTQDRILCAARELFSQAAYENVQTRQIAARADVNVALLNHYFGSKKKLFEAVLDDIFADLSPFPPSGILEELGKRLSCAFSRENAHTEIEALNIIIFSAASPEVSPLVKERFLDAMRDIAKKLGNEDDISPICVFTACTLGAMVTRHLLPADTMPDLPPDSLREQLSVLLNSLRPAKAMVDNCDRAYH